MSDCRKCAEFDWCVENEDCGLFKLKPQTNADRIRAMTDEELARFLWQAAPYDNCPPIKCIEFETLKKPTTDECIACWGRWLRTEVTE